MVRLNLCKAADDIDRFLDGAERQLDVDGGGFRRVQDDALADEGLEALERGGNLVAAGIEVLHGIDAAAVGHRLERDARIDVDHRDRDAGQDTALRIVDGAGDAGFEFLGADEGAGKQRECGE